MSSRPINATTPFSTLIREVESGAQPVDLLPELHREVLSASGAAASLVLQRVAHSGDYRATSGAGVPALTGMWLRGADARALEAAAGDDTAVRDLSAVPELRDRLRADRGVIVTLTGLARAAFLVVAGDALTSARAAEIAPRARIEFTLAIELARLARERALRQRLQELFLAFSRGVSATLRLGVALETLAQDANALFGTDRTAVWLHRRRAHDLVMAASSEPGYAAGVSPVSTEDTGATAARGLRLERPLLGGEDDHRLLVAPLRGWRRALGTIVVEGQSAFLDDEQLGDMVAEFSHQLSIGIENVQLLEDVLQQRRLLEDTFNSLVDLVIVTDHTLRVVQTNEAFAARVGVHRTALLGRGLADLVGAEMSAWVQRHEPGPGARSLQLTDEKLGGTFSATVTPLITENGDPVGHVLVIRDITGQVRLETEREELRGRLAQSEKLASLGQFVAGIAHEMNNPLQGILGHLELLIETSAAARPLRAELRRIYQDGDRAAKIVRNLLVFAGSQRMSRRRLGIERVLTRALASRSAALRRGGIEVARQQTPELPRVVGDPLLLQQAFLNILINAEHATAERDADRRIEISTSLTHDNRRVVATVRDNGPGIPPDILPRIFDPFFTTKEVGKGTGLGLAITYGIIQEHGGAIRASNSPEGGAVFTIELPAAE